jgi:hypothetical protein
METSFGGQNDEADSMFENVDRLLARIGFQRTEDEKIIFIGSVGDQPVARSRPEFEEAMGLWERAVNLQLLAKSQEREHTLLKSAITEAEGEQKIFEAELKVRQNEWDLDVTRAEQQAARSAVFTEVLGAVFTGLSPDVFATLSPENQDVILSKGLSDIIAKDAVAPPKDDSAARETAFAEFERLFGEGVATQGILDLAEFLPVGLLNIFERRQEEEEIPPTTTGGGVPRIIYR